MFTLHDFTAMAHTRQDVIHNAQYKQAEQKNINAIRPPHLIPRRSNQNLNRTYLRKIAVTQCPHMESIFARRKIIVSHPVHTRLGAEPLVAQFLNLILIGYLLRIVILQRGEDDTERIIVMSQLEHIRIRHRRIDNGMPSRTRIFPHRLVEDKEVRNPDLGVFQHTPYG